MNIKNNPYYWSHFLRLFVTLFTAPSFSVRKFVWLCTHHLTIYLTILHSFLSVSSRRCGACAAPSAEHARPQASPPSSLPSQSSPLLFYTIPIHFLHSISHPSDLEFASIVSLLPLLPLHNNYRINYESLLLTTHHSLSLLILLHTQCIMDSCFWSPENMKDGTLQFVFLHYREDQSTYDSNDSSIFVPVITHIPHKEHIGVMWECLDEIDVDPCCCHSLSSFFLLHLHLFFHFHSISHLSLRISPISLVTLHWYSLPYVNTHNEHHSPHTTIDSIHDSQTSCIYTSIPFSHPTHSNISTDLPNLIHSRTKHPSVMYLITVSSHQVSSNLTIKQHSSLSPNGISNLFSQSHMHFFTYLSSQIRCSNTSRLTNGHSSLLQKPIHHTHLSIKPISIQKLRNLSWFAWTCLSSHKHHFMGFHTFHNLGFIFIHR